MCRFSDEQLRELEGLITHLVVEQESHGVRKDFAQQPTRQMPQIACPHPLYEVASDELTENGVYPITKPAEEGTSLGIRVSLLGGVGGQNSMPISASCSLVFGEW